MTSKADEYRASAAECQRMADRTRNEADKAQWLRLAQSWMKLAYNERLATGEEVEAYGGRYQQQQQPQPRDGE